MAKRNRKPKVVVEEVDEIAAGHVQLDEQHQLEVQNVTEMEPELVPETEMGEEEKVVNSVVAAKYKDKYIENAKANGINHKAAKRSNWDWLAQQLANACLNPKGKISIECFLGVLEANAIDHAKWPNRNKGWEGRLRMTGRVALQKIVANNGRLNFADGTSVEAPEAWVKLYKKD